MENLSRGPFDQIQAQREKLESNAEQLGQVRKLREEQAFADKDKAERDRKANKDRHDLLELAKPRGQISKSKLHSSKSA